MASASPVNLGLSIFTQVFYAFNTAASPQIGTDPGPYRPSQWSQQNVTADKGGPTVALLVTSPTVFPKGTVFEPGQNIQWYTTTVYVFDAIIRANHEQELVITTHPVQTGANIADHAYRKAARLTLEIAMSDSMQSFVAGQFESTPSRSVSAYQLLLTCQRNRQLLGVATRFWQYGSMLIKSLRIEENAATRYAGKFFVEFEEIILPTIGTVLSTTTSGAPARAGSVGFGPNFDPNKLSVRPQTTGQTPVGQTQPQQVPSVVSSQHAISNAASQGISLLRGASVPGAGYWSSNNLTAIGQLTAA